MSKTTIAYVKLVRDEHGTIIYSEDADHLLRDAVALRAQAYRDGYKAGKDAEREACKRVLGTLPIQISEMSTIGRAIAAIDARGQS